MAFAIRIPQPENRPCLPLLTRFAHHRVPPRCHAPSTCWPKVCHFRLRPSKNPGLPLPILSSLNIVPSNTSSPTSPRYLGDVLSRHLSRQHVRTQRVIMIDSSNISIDYCIDFSNLARAILLDKLAFLLLSSTCFSTEFSLPIKEAKGLSIKLQVMLCCWV
jgi:hypothetical protein